MANQTLLITPDADGVSTIVDAADGQEVPGITQVTATIEMGKAAALVTAYRLVPGEPFRKDGSINVEMPVSTERRCYRVVRLELEEIPDAPIEYAVSLPRRVRGYLFLDESSPFAALVDRVEQTMQVARGWRDERKYGD